MWIWFFMSGCIVILIVMWFIFGRDKKTIPVITVSPPEGLDPLEMEYAQIATITDKGIYAMFLYWMSKGYLRFREEGGRICMDKKADLADDPPEHAAFLFDGLFREAGTVFLDRLPAGVTEHKGEVRDKVAGRFTGKNKVVESDTMYATMAAMGILILTVFIIEVTVSPGVFLPALLGAALFAGLVLLQNGAVGFRSKYDRFEVIAGSILTFLTFAGHLCLLYIYAGLPFTLFFIVCFLICVPCVMFMERRTNQRLYGQILGFRGYIETAEWDRLKEMSENDPSYGLDILPYAMLFNMGTRWTGSFENKTIYAAVEEMEKMTDGDSAA